MYEEFVKLANTVRKTEASFRAKPELWHSGGWFRPQTGQRCVMAAIGEQHTGGKYLHGRDHTGKGGVMIVALQEQLTWLAFDMGLLAPAPGGSPRDIIDFNDSSRDVRRVIGLLQGLGEALEELAAWQAELDGLVPMVEITVTEQQEVTTHV